MRVIAIDLGDAHTGVAISDNTGLVAGYAAVIHSSKTDGIIAAIMKLVSDYHVEDVVVGLPKNMNGTEGPRAEICRGFAALLSQHLGQQVVLWDERCTTVEAHRILHENGKKMKDHKKTVDAVAATLILQGYLAWKQR